VRLTHIGICVSDCERSLRFYCDGLGFRRVRELEVKGEPSDTLLRLRDVELRAVYLVRDGVCIELLHYASPGYVGDGRARAMNALGLTHLSLAVEDLGAAAARLEAAGGRVLGETRIDVPASGTRAIFATDPDGTLVELVQQPGG
jgi:catechol 2,3-dioxygenase-like lactoylglutathione lyase family enzyme